MADDQTLQDQIEDTVTAEDIAADAEVVMPAIDGSDDSEETEVEAPEEQEVVTQNPNHVVVSDLTEEDKTAKGAKWYVLHTYAGHENRVAEQMKQRVQTMNLNDFIYEMLIPTQEKIRVRRGQRETIKEKIFPGYMMIRMKLTDASWLCVRTTQGVTGFVGIGSKPTPLPKHEVEAIQKFMAQGTPSYKAEFSVGEAVKIVDGPFNDFIGTVDAIDIGKGKVTVLVSFFGRETPVELDFLQVSKL